MARLPLKALKAVGRLVPGVSTAIGVADIVSDLRGGAKSPKTQKTRMTTFEKALAIEEAEHGKRKKG